MTIEENLILIRQLVADYEQKYERIQGSVRLLAASKGQSTEKIQAALHAGQYSFGENYVQEALKKITALADKDIEWHFIGHIQTNKIRKIAEHFAWVHSVDDMKIAKGLSDRRPINLPPLNICIEVNVSHEATKSGVSFDDVVPLVKYCLNLPRIHLRGFMTIPAPQSDFTTQRNEFHKLNLLWQALRDEGIALDTLSMGMSDDFEAAIAEGSTLVRIGTAIFGQRAPKH